MLEKFLSAGIWTQHLNNQDTNMASGSVVGYPSKPESILQSLSKPLFGMKANTWACVCVCMSVCACVWEGKCVCVCVWASASKKVIQSYFDNPRMKLKPEINPCPANFSTSNDAVAASEAATAFQALLSILQPTPSLTKRQHSLVFSTCRKSSWLTQLP